MSSLLHMLEINILINLAAYTLAANLESAWEPAMGATSIVAKGPLL